MKILVKVKNVFGVEKVYPVCETAINLARLAGTKTLTEESIHTIKQLGYEIEVQTPSL